MEYIEYIELGHLEKAPVVYVFCKVGFATLPLLNQSRADNIAEKIRKYFPNFFNSKTQARKVSISTETQEIKSSEIEEINEWSYVAPDYTKGFTLSKNGVSFHTKKYNQSSDFFDWILDILNIVQEELNITHTNFHGIRYIDRIDLGENNDFDLVVTNGFFQPTLKCTPSKLGCRIESIYKSEVGILNLKSVTKIGGYDIPDDLISEAEKLKAVENIHTPFIVIDTDSFEHTENMEPFHVLGSIKKLDDLHKVASLAFREIINVDELNSWRGI
jgi:uncharacterized protein (TIGR04255 family)